MNDNTTTGPVKVKRGRKSLPRVTSKSNVSDDDAFMHTQTFRTSNKLKALMSYWVKSKPDIFDSEGTFIRSAIICYDKILKDIEFSDGLTVYQWQKEFREFAASKNRK